MARQGPRAKPRWSHGDRVTVAIDAQNYHGTIHHLTGTGALIHFDDGDELTISLSDLRRGPPAEYVEEEDIPHPNEPDGGRRFEGSGFNQYPVKWRDGIWFSLQVEGGKFYGNYRKTVASDSYTGERTIAHAIDIWVEYKGHTYVVDSIMYTSGDPREDRRSLNGDICAAANLFLYRRIGDGSLQTLHDLQKAAKAPIVQITRLETLDRILLSLRAFRDTAIRAGGFRTFTIEGDTVAGGPVMSLCCDFTTQAVALEGGPIPSLYEGRIYDSASTGEVQGRLTMDTSPENVQALVDRLAETKDKGEARRIRATLRKMGHRGGARSSKPSKGSNGAKE